MIEEVIQQLNAKEDLDFLAMKSTLEAIMSGEVDDLLIEAFLIGLNEVLRKLRLLQLRVS